MGGKVRFAPSPTGSLHLGGVRTALYNYLLARKTEGRFVIRIEDTDIARNQKNAEVNQLNDLTWLGLTWDEGPRVGGESGPYYQSERGDIYQRYANQLIDAGHAFYCFLTDTEIEGLLSKENRQLKSPYRDMPLNEAKARIAKGDAYVVRFKNNEIKRFVFEDMVHGETALSTDMVGDFVLIRANGLPVYNFCCVIDDHLMEITAVLRGEEHLSNTLRQLMLYEALGFTIPRFGHLSMILGANRKKLSKRDEACSIQDFINQGYLPEAILNYVALLGWSDENGKETFTLDELISHFSMSRVNKSPAMFDRDKLNWVNHYHLNQKPAGEILPYLKPLYEGQRLDDETWFETFWSLIGHQFYTLKEVVECLKLFDEVTVYEAALLEEGQGVLRDLLTRLSSLTVLNEETFKAILAECSQALSVKGKRLFAPVRVALIGVSSGMELSVLASLLTKEEMIARIERALKTLD